MDWSPLPPADRVAFRLNLRFLPRGKEKESIKVVDVYGSPRLVRLVIPGLCTSVRVISMREFVLDVWILSFLKPTFHRLTVLVATKQAALGITTAAGSRVRMGACRKCICCGGLEAMPSTPSRWPAWRGGALTGNLKGTHGVSRDSRGADDIPQEGC